MTPDDTIGITVSVTFGGALHHEALALLWAEAILLKLRELRALDEEHFEEAD